MAVLKLILLLLSVLSLLSFCFGVDNSPKKFSIDAIYQFGDSISDTGNLIRDNVMGARSPCGRLPYGEAIGQPTGRCSDGFLMIDYIASFFKLPLLNAYLQRGADFTHGVNFAVAGSTALDTYTLAARQILSPTTSSSLSIQLNWFRSHLNSICSNKIDCKDKLKTALFLMGEIGGNDYNYDFFQGKTMEQLYGIVPQVLEAIKNAVEEIISYGASQVIVPGNFPIGCMPIYLTRFQTTDPTMYDDLNCLKDLNDFAKFHNDQLQQAIKELQQEHPDVHIVYGDYFSALKMILQQASSLGFDRDKVQKACCGIGNNNYNFDMTRMCGNIGVPVCPEPAKHVSWDGIHLTQHAYERMAESLLSNYLAT